MGRNKTAKREKERDYSSPTTPSLSLHHFSGKRIRFVVAGPDSRPGIPAGRPRKPAGRQVSTIPAGRLRKTGRPSKDLAFRGPADPAGQHCVAAAWRCCCRGIARRYGNEASECVGCCKVVRHGTSRCVTVRHGASRCVTARHGGAAAVRRAGSTPEHPQQCVAAACHTPHGGCLALPQHSGPKPLLRIGSRRPRGVGIAAWSPPRGAAGRNGWVVLRGAPPPQLIGGSESPTGRHWQGGSRRRCPPPLAARQGPPQQEGGDGTAAGGATAVAEAHTAEAAGRGHGHSSSDRRPAMGRGLRRRQGTATLALVQCVGAGPAVVEALTQRAPPPVPTSNRDSWATPCNHRHGPDRRVSAGTARTAV
jgi:hypothetical protein